MRTFVLIYVALAAGVGAFIHSRRPKTPSRITQQFLLLMPSLVFAVAGLVIFPVCGYRSYSVPRTLFETFLMIPYVTLFTGLLLIALGRSDNTLLIKRTQAVIGMLCLGMLLRHTWIITRAELAGGWAG
jgi:hypothetical protein